MGRCNNKRTQAAAETLRNTPSRARFSKGPPSKNKGRKPRNSSKTNNDNASSSSSSSKTKKGGATAATHRVIDKLASRVQSSSASTTTRPTTATKEQALQYLDKSKLDTIQLPDDIIQNITTLLEDLGVKQSHPNSKTAATTAAATTTTRQEMITSSNDDNEENESINLDWQQNITLLDAEAASFEPKKQAARPQRNVGYSEYEDDADDIEQNELEDGYTPRLPAEDFLEEDGDDHSDDNDDGDGDWHGHDQPIGNQSSLETEANEITPKVDDYQDLKENKAFWHLSQRLSFSKADAARACRAIEGWDTGQDTQEENGDNKARAQPTPTSKSEDISLAMDWLCLHLNESQLTAGFRTNAKPPSKIQQPLSVSGLSLSSTKFKAIPHSSISIATPLTSDKEWSRSVRVQERVLGLVRLGFAHSEATTACTEDLDPVPSPMDDPALLRLLGQLDATKREEEGGEPIIVDSFNATDLAFAVEECQQEREALEAIYDDQFHVHNYSSQEQQGGEVVNMTRYTLSISPAEDLIPPARSADCRLHIFPRPGYPVLQTPLLLFTNKSLPPSLLKRINLLVAAISRQSLGAPVVFEVVTVLSEQLYDLQSTFVKEQKKKEFEATQLRLRLDAGHDVIEQVTDARDETDGKLGRRQRAKLKAAERAFNHPDVMALAEKERKERQAQRIEMAQHANTNIRESLANAAILKREQEKMDEDAENTYRSAMSRAFNEGKSVEEARALAKAARNMYLKEHGVALSEDDGENENGAEQETRISNGEGEEVDGAGDANASTEEQSATRVDRDKTAFDKTTPTTTAFMDRLREMYDNASKAKASGTSGTSQGTKSTQDLDAYHLSRPVERSSPEELTQIPRPIAVPTGDMGEVMKQVITTQEEQPWLISSEARVPSLGGESVGVRKQSHSEQQISERLLKELKRKLAKSEEWAQRNPGGNARRGAPSMGFTPERFQSMMSTRRRLPAFKMEQEVVNTICSNQITVIAGDTGCGKTTQVPQLVLDHLISLGQGARANMIVTQPRRISAIGVSERIAEERCEKVGETCGYSIKLEKRTSSKTRLLLCTTGILLRRLQCDPDLASVSHIFVDEVHERDLNTDFLIIILKDLLSRRKELKLVLMSATLNSDAFSKYFGECPVVNIPGRAHPVEENRLEDILEMTGYKVEEHSDFALKRSASKPPKVSKSVLRKRYYPRYSKETIESLFVVDETIINYELLAALLEHISLNQDDGAILVFMPGMMEITKTVEEMYKKEYFQSDKVRIYPLHSSLSTAEQKAIFEIPPEGVRKIVVSTNIAETSITIEDVVYVVDSGRVKENRRDEMNETPTLVECWVSRASAKQRRGRAGRVRPGVAYHMYSSHTHDQDIQDYQLPEMLRVGIEDLVLQILILDLGEPSQFLRKALNPPSDLAMTNSLKLLEGLGAVECQWQAKKAIKHETITGEGATEPGLRVSSELTALGFHLATLPVDPRVGKMMIYGSLFGCTEPALTVAASMSARSPFMSPFDQRDAADAARKKFSVEASDHLTILNAFSTWKEIRSNEGNRAVSAFLKENFLGRLTLFQMEDSRKQFAGLLRDIGFLPKSFKLKDLHGSANVNSDNLELVKAVLCAGLYPNIIVAPRTLVSGGGGKSSGKAGEHAFHSHTKGQVYLHPSTVAFEEARLDSRYCCYHEMVKTSKAYVRDCTTISPLALLLFGGKLDVYQSHGICAVDDWLKFKIEAKPATLVKYLRSQMEKVLLRKIVSPEDDVTGSVEGKALIQSISILFARHAEEKANAPDRTGGEIVQPWTGNDEHDDGPSRQQRQGRGGRGRGRGRGGRGERGRGGRGGRGRGGRGRGQR